VEKNSKIQPQTASKHQLIKPTQPTPCQRKFPSQYSADETLKIQGVGLCRATNKITGLSIINVTFKKIQKSLDKYTQQTPSK
jgi:hypothetical protein